MTVFFPCSVSEMGKEPSSATREVAHRAAPACPTGREHGQGSAVAGCAQCHRASTAAGPQQDPAPCICMATSIPLPRHPAPPQDASPRSEMPPRLAIGTGTGAQGDLISWQQAGQGRAVQLPPRPGSPRRSPLRVAVTMAWRLLAPIRRTKPRRYSAALAEMRLAAGEQRSLRSLLSHCLFLLPSLTTLTSARCPARGSESSESSEAGREGWGLRWGLGATLCR